MTNTKFEVVGKRIKSKMLELGLRHKDLVNQIGVSKGTVTHWINGTSAPTAERLDKLCQILEVEKSELIAGNFNQNNTANSLLGNNKLINSLNVKVPYFKKVSDYFSYINTVNELNPMLDNDVNKDLDFIDIPKTILERSSVSENDTVILKKTANLLNGSKGGLDLFFDTSITKATTNGHYLISFGELKDVRELVIHPVTGEIEILDLDGTGKLPPASVKNFNVELIILAKAFYAGIALN